MKSNENNKLADPEAAEIREQESCLTIKAAMRFFLEVFQAYEEKESFPVPDFLPANEASIDIHWLMGPFELLVNIGKDGATGSFFGDRYGTGAISGSCIPRPQEIAKWIAENNRGHRGAPIISQSPIHSDQAKALFALYCAHHDSVCIFDERRSAAHLAAIETIATNLEIPIKEIHQQWLEYRHRICGALGTKISHPTEKLAKVEL